MAVPAHHVRSQECVTRLPYRSGRRATAVKVYTINQESRYLIINGVPEVGGSRELLELCGQYGTLQSHRLLADYPTEPFTEAYLITYEKIQSARIAKRKLDDQNVLGGVLHVFYAPEYETVEDTRSKLIDRRKMVARKISQHEAEQKAEARILDKIPQDMSQSVRVDDHRSRGQEQNKHAHFQPQVQHFQPESQDASKRSFGGISQSGNADAQSSCSVESRRGVGVTGAGASTVPLQPWQVGSAGAKGMPEGAKVNGNDFQPSASLVAQEESLLAFHQSLRLPVPALDDTSGASSRRSSRNSFARVPSSHATLPKGYDGRLPDRNREDNSRRSVPSKVDKSANKDGVSRGENWTDPNSTGDALLSRDPPQHSQEGRVSKTYQGNKKLLSLVPRQALKKGTNDSSRNAHSRTCPIPPVPKDDSLSEQLRKEALTLSAPQGPVTAEGRDASATTPTPAEKSLEVTVRHIRKRLSQIISETVPKKLRATDREKGKVVET